MDHLLDAVAFVLADQGCPQTCDWLVSLMEEMKLYRVKGNDPAKTVRARIRADINRRGLESRFIETADGRFGLRRKPE